MLDRRDFVEAARTLPGAEELAAGGPVVDDLALLVAEYDPIG